MGPPCYKHDQGFDNTSARSHRGREKVEKCTVNTRRRRRKHYLRSLTRLFPSPPPSTNHLKMKKEEEEEVTNWLLRVGPPKQQQRQINIKRTRVSFSSYSFVVNMWMAEQQQRVLLVVFVHGKVAARCRAVPGKNCFAKKTDRNGTE